MGWLFEDDPEPFRDMKDRKDKAGRAQNSHPGNATEGWDKAKPVAKPGEESPIKWGSIPIGNKKEFADACAKERERLEREAEEFRGHARMAEDKVKAKEKELERAKGQSDENRVAKLTEEVKELKKDAKKVKNYANKADQAATFMGRAYDNRGGFKAASEEVWAAGKALPSSYANKWKSDLVGGIKNKATELAKGDGCAIVLIAFSGGLTTLGVLGAEVVRLIVS